MKRWIAWALCVCLLMCLCACSAVGEATAGLINVEYKKADLNAEWKLKDAVPVTFDGRLAEISGGGAYMDGDTLIVNGKGDYLLSGEFAGRIVVDADKDDKVRLILSGLRLTTGDSAAIFVRRADKATITLAEGSENTIIAGARLLTEDDEALEAAIYSKADLVINGSGSLNVDSPNGHGILSKDDLRLIDGRVTVNAYADGVRGRDAIQMRGGVISIAAGGDGMKSNNDEDADRGYISIEGGEVNISAGEDGIQAETVLQILAGRVNIENSYEGMEAQRMLIAGGEISVTSVEDGLNAAGGDEGAENRNPFAAGSQTLTVSGGVLYVNASGDGIDSNGALSFTGGEVYVSGPTDDKNGALDASGEMTLSGGILLAAGSSGMAVEPRADGQAVTMIDLIADLPQPAGGVISIRDAAGLEIVSFAPQKEWTNLVISHPEISEGEQILVYVNDALAAEATAGEEAQRRRKWLW